MFRSPTQQFHVCAVFQVAHQTTCLSQRVQCVLQVAHQTTCLSQRVKRMFDLLTTEL